MTVQKKVSPALTRDFDRREVHRKPPWHPPTLKEVGIRMGTDAKQPSATESSELAVVGPS